MASFIIQVCLHINNLPSSNSLPGSPMTKWRAHTNVLVEKVGWETPSPLAPRSRIDALYRDAI